MERSNIETHRSLKQMKIEFGANMVSIESISGIPILRIVPEKFMRRIDAA